MINHIQTGELFRQSLSQKGNNFKTVSQNLSGNITKLSWRVRQPCRFHGNQDLQPCFFFKIIMFSIKKGFIAIIYFSYCMHMWKFPSRLPPFIPVLSKVEYIWLIQNWGSKVADAFSSFFDNKRRHHNITAIVKVYLQLFQERLSENMCTQQSRNGIWSINCSWHCSCRKYFCCFPLALANIHPWPLVPFFQILFKNCELSATHNTFRHCGVHFFRHPFSK